MWLPFLIVALPISLADIRAFTIPNVYLWWLTLLCTPYVLLNGLGPISNLIFVTVLLVSLYFVGLGMGDAKLISIISMSVNSDVRTNFSYLALLMLVSASCYAILRILWSRKFPHTIPLAPSIFAALALYLATS
jgi:Flp pilus assembly protein protease CpaA